MERQKLIKLVAKICEKIISNPSQTSKYGNLNWKRINNKISHSKIALELLFVAGFHIEIIDGKKRLIWNNTHENMKRIQSIHTISSGKEEDLKLFILDLANNIPLKE